MAKGLNLTDTAIIELNVLVHGDGSDALVRTRYVVLDENGDDVRTDFQEEEFSDMTNQERANLNNFLRLKSQQVNLDHSGPLQPLLVPLSDDAAGHRGRLQRYHLAQGRPREHHSAVMDAQVARDAVQLRHDAQEMLERLSC